MLALPAGRAFWTASGKMAHARDDRGFLRRLLGRLFEIAHQRTPRPHWLWEVGRRDGTYQPVMT